MEKEKVVIKERTKIRLNNEDAIITEVWNNIGFYYKSVSEIEESEQRFCNTLFSTINFEPIFT